MTGATPTHLAVGRRSVLAGVGAAAGFLAGCSGPGRIDSLPTPVFGDPEASITVAVYEDFACPHCRTFALEILPELASEYVEPGVVRYEHHDFPIPVSERWSWVVPSAARAVQDANGAAAFFEFAERCYANQGRYSLGVLADLADDVGVDGEEIRRAAEGQRYRPVIEADRKSGADRGVRGTPAVIVDGTLLGGYGYDRVADAIEAAR